MNYKFTLLFTAVSMVFDVVAQDKNELERRLGFKNIRLESHPDSVPGSKLVKEFLEKNEFPVKRYSVSHEDFKRIGEVEVTSLELKAYKDRIYEIKVETLKDVRLMKALELAFGKSDYDLKKQTYFWKTDKIILLFRSLNKKHIELVYLSPVIFKQMERDKNRRVEDIAEDF